MELEWPAENAVQSGPNESDANANKQTIKEIKAMLKSQEE